MGDTMELVQEGALCQVCLCWVDDEAEGDEFAPGYPRTCADCLEEQKTPKKRKSGAKKRKARLDREVNRIKKEAAELRKALKGE